MIAGEDNNQKEQSALAVAPNFIELLDEHMLNTKSTMNMVIKVCCKFGDLDILKEIAQAEKYKKVIHDPDCLYTAAKFGQLHIMVWFFENNPTVYNNSDVNLQEVFTLAVKSGCIDAVRYLYDNFSHVTDLKAAMMWPAMTGHLEVVKFLHEHKIDKHVVYKAETMDWAACTGHLDVLKWLHCNRTEGCSENAMNWAADKGNLEVLTWLHEHYPHVGCCAKAMDFAAKNGHIHVLQFLQTHYPQVGCSTDAMDNAAAFGHLDVVKWLHENRTEGCTTDAMDRAALKGHLHVVEWLHENRTEGCTSDAINNAAKNGHLLIVQFLCNNRFEGCTASALKHATERGQFRVAQFLRENLKEDKIFQFLSSTYAKTSVKLDTANEVIQP